jgi:hypothetical protein
MPSGLFKRSGDRWVFNGPQSPELQHYTGDQAELLVRYMFTLTPQEQAALVGHTPAAAKGSGGGK